MAEFVFEGDLNSVRKPQLDFISDVLEKKGFKGPTVLIEPVGNVGDNYMANVKRIMINENGKTFKIIAKFAPENPMMRKTSMVENLFSNEKFAYTTMFPKFEEKWNIADVPENERIKFPKFYGALMESPNEVILLEDLKESGYDSVSRFESISEEGLKMIIRFISIYHSMSFVLRYQEPETFASYQAKLEFMKNPDREMIEDFKRHLEGIENQALNVLENDKHKEIMRGTVTSMPALDIKIRNIIKDSKHTVIQHGDAWITNVMFISENEEPKQCLVVDYQMIKENSPIYDLMFMIFNSTTHKQRSTNFYYYIDYYHNELDKSLSNFGLKANLVYPRDKLDADLKTYGKFAFAFNVMFASISSRNTEEAGKMKEFMEMDEKPDPEKLEEIMAMKDEKTLALFKARVEDLIDSYCQFGLI